MIVSDDKLVAHIGGPSGVTLSLAEPGGAFRVAVEYERDFKAQAAAQRRLLLTAEHLFVLEPAKGVFFEDDREQVLRVRRLDRGGREVDVVEAPGEEGRAQLAYLAIDEARPGRLDIHLFGIDPESGRPLRTFREIPARGWGRISHRRFIPAWHGEDLYVPLRGSPLYRFRGDSVESFPIVAERVEILGERVACLGRDKRGAGVWLDGVWHHLTARRLHSGFKEFAGRGIVEAPGGGLLALDADGGELPGVLGAPPARLPPGLYSGFVPAGDALFAVEESGAPRQVAVEL